MNDYSKCEMCYYCPEEGAKCHKVTQGRCTPDTQEKFVTVTEVQNMSKPKKIKELEERITKLEELIVKHSQKHYLNECGFPMREEDVKKILED